jgi:hypothetical protein
MSVFPRFFCFIAFSGVTQRWEFKNTQKTFLQKAFDQKSKTVFSRFFLSRFWAFLGEGSSGWWVLFRNGKGGREKKRRRSDVRRK